MRSMGEGHGRMMASTQSLASGGCPTTPTLRVAVPIPVAGRIRFVR